MNKKYVIVIIGVILFLVLTTIIKSEPLINKTVKEKEQEVHNPEIEKSQELNIIDYYNLEGENRALQAQIDHQNQTIFELNKVIVGSGTLEELQHELTKVLYKEVTDENIILLTQEDGSDDYSFSFITVDQRLGGIITKIEDDQRVNWTTGHGLYFGIIQDDAIKTVNVYKNEQVYETRILDIEEGLRLWFVLVDYEVKSKNDELDQIKIQALDSNGNVLWKESFENDFDIEV